MIGGGQAGLALGHFLARQGLRFVDPRGGRRGRRRLARALGLAACCSRRRYDSLPGLPFPGDPDDYPTRDEVVAYLERYAAELRLPVAARTAPSGSLAPRDGTLRRSSWTTARIEADQVVVATGPFQVPRVPPLAAGLEPEVVQLHSTDYRSPARLPQGTVLVVGGGNTGFQIAEELAAHAPRSISSIGSRQTPLPQRLLGRDLFWWLEPARPAREDGRLAARAADAASATCSSARARGGRGGTASRLPAARRRRVRADRDASPTAASWRSTP